MNCRGLGDHLKLLGIPIDLNKLKPGGKLRHDYIIELQESKLYKLSSKPKAILNSNKMNHLNQPCSHNNSGGLLVLLIPNKWKIESFYQSQMALALKKSESGSLSALFLLIHSARTFSLLSGLAIKLAEQRRDIRILVGHDLHSRSSTELYNLDLQHSDRRIQRYNIICNIFETIGCFDFQGREQNVSHPI